MKTTQSEAARTSIPVHEDVLPGSARAGVAEIGHADIVVGIPSYNNADTIERVVRAVYGGMRQYFPGLRGAIINSDGGSKDGTPKKVLDTPHDDSPIVQVSYPVSPIHKLTTPYNGIPGKGSALRAVFVIAEKLGARACAVVDSDLRSITPEWIDLLLRPILYEGFDFTAPFYQRHKYDGTITNSIVYPMTRALYGKRIRQPIGGEFGFSRAVLHHYLKQEVWHTDVARFGIDIWMTTQAVCGGFRVCQTFLGAKIHDPKDPGSDLAAMLVQVVGSLFAEMERNSSIWPRVQGSEPVPIYGPQFKVTTEPVKVNVRRMIDSFRLGCEQLREVWEAFLPASTLEEFASIAKMDDVHFAFPDRTWAHTVYDFAVAFHKRVIGRDHLLRALTPLYLGWVASFVIQMKEASPEEVEERLERLCQVYEAEKNYLLARWD